MASGARIVSGRDIFNKYLDQDGGKIGREQSISLGATFGERSCLEFLDTTRLSNFSISCRKTTTHHINNAMVTQMETGAGCVLLWRSA